MYFFGFVFKNEFWNIFIIFACIEPGMLWTHQLFSRLKFNNRSSLCEIWGCHSGVDEDSNRSLLWCPSRVAAAVLFRLLDPEFEGVMILRKVWNYFPSDMVLLCFCNCRFTLVIGSLIQFNFQLYVIWYTLFLSASPRRHFIIRLVQITTVLSIYCHIPTCLYRTRSPSESCVCTSM